MTLLTINPLSVLAACYALLYDKNLIVAYLNFASFVESILQSTTIPNLLLIEIIWRYGTF